MAENKNIKRKLIIQSFMPLYFILVIKNFDEEMLILVKKMTEHLLKRDFKIICNAVDHPLFLSCIFEISVFDTKAPDKESSYHTLLVGLLVGNVNWLVKSNVEAGDGFADIVVETEDPDAGIVMELKYVKVASELEKACEKALAQIKDRRYEEYLKNDGRNNILFYGLAFCKKRCKVIVESRGMYSTVL